MMKCGQAMSVNRQFQDGRRLADARSNGGICDKMLVGLVLYTLVRAGNANAGEQPSITEARRSPSANAAALPLAATFDSRAAPDSTKFSATEFRPRGRSINEAEPIAGASAENPMLRGTTVWQRMEDFRSHDRVRVLTLWQSGGGTVSLQAGKGGSPSLQWTSGVMNRGEATRGLLDRILSVSIAGAGSGLRGAVRSLNTAAPSKQMNLSAAGSGNPLGAPRP
jgi:hypothetical protein